MPLFVNVLILLFAGLLCVSSAHSQIADVAFQLPMSVDSVETHRVDDSLIRIVRHNMELKPLLEIERMATTSNMTLVEALRIEAVMVEGELLQFNDTAGVFVESISLNNGVVAFVLDYFFLRGGRALIRCVVDVGNNRLGPLACSYL